MSWSRLEASGPQVGQHGAVGTTAPSAVERPESDGRRPDLPWVTIVWNDPVNLMSYVTYVFQSCFGYPRRRPRS